MTSTTSVSIYIGHVGQQTNTRGSNRNNNTNSIASLKAATTSATGTTDQLINSLCRTSSLARYQYRNDEGVSNKSNQHHQHQQRYNPTPDPSHYPTEQSNYHDTLHESGGRKILNFLQRGFQTKRPKSMVKSEQRKNVKHRSNSISSYDQNLPRSLSVVSIERALGLLGNKSIYQQSCTMHSIQNDEGVEDTDRLVQICTIDPSLLGSCHGNYCFQVMSPSKRMMMTESQSSKTSGTAGNFQSNSTDTTINIPFEIHNYSCQSALERDRWVQFLKRLVNPAQDAQRRKENCLTIWIQEAKGLSGKNRYYCTIHVNGTICARTTVKQMTDMLFWGEEFDLSGLTECSELTIQIWKADSASLHRHHTSSPHRLSLNRRHRHHHHQQVNTSPPPMRKAMLACTRAVDDDGSVSPPDFSAFRNSLILDDLSIIPTDNNNNNDNNSEVRSGQKRRKFKSSKVSKSSLVATVNICLSDISNSGEVEAWYTPQSSEATGLCNRLKQVDNQNSTNEILVHKTKSRGKHSNRDADSNYIQIRVKIRYRALTVLPLSSYARLQANLCRFQMPTTSYLQNGFKFSSSSPISTTSNKPDLIQLLSSLDPWLNVKAKAELAGSMVVLQQARGQVTEFLTSLILCEVRKQTDPNMVLRANSIATKATEIYLRLVGGTYLSNILSDFVQTVIYGQPVSSTTPTSPTARHYPIDYEVDIAKVHTSSQLAENQLNLLCLVESVWKKILASEGEFLKIRHHLDCSKDTNSPVSDWKNNNTNKKGQLDAVNSSVSGTLCEHVISACLFLRYICPAILSPSLFNLTQEFPSEPRVLRAFTLVAKTIQHWRILVCSASTSSCSTVSPFNFNPSCKTDFFTEILSSTVLKSINSLSNICNNNNGCHGNTDSNKYINTYNGSVPHSLHMMISDENLLNSALSNCGRRQDNSLETRFINSSQSNHEGFIGDTYRLKDFLHRSNHSRGCESPRVINKLHNSKFSMNGDSSVKPLGDESSRHKTCHNTPTAVNSIILPPLPTGHQYAPHLGLRDHVDLPLCLALCHLQLSEAIEKVPEQNRQSNINELKSILDEVNTFLVSGKDPQPNWWCTNQPASTAVTLNNIGGTIPTNNMSNIPNSKPSSLPSSSSPSPNVLLNMSQMSLPCSNQHHHQASLGKSKLMNTADSSDGTISPQSTSISSATSFSSFKNIVLSETKKDNHYSNSGSNKNLCKSTTDSNIELVVSRGHQSTSGMQERVLRCDSIEIIKIPHSNNNNNFIQVRSNFPCNSVTTCPQYPEKKSPNSKRSVEIKDTLHHHPESNSKIDGPKRRHETIVIYREPQGTMSRTHAHTSMDNSVRIDQFALRNRPTTEVSSETNPQLQTEQSAYHGNILCNATVDGSSFPQMNNPLYTCHDSPTLMQQINPVTNPNNPAEYFADKIILLSNTSVGSSSQPKNTPQEQSVRRHTYVNLSTAPETMNILTGTLKDSHPYYQTGQSTAVNNVELDRRNWAPPVYMSIGRINNDAGGRHNGASNVHYTDQFSLLSGQQELYRSSSTLETEMQRMQFIPIDIPHTVGAPPSKRTALFLPETNTPIPGEDFRSELDASQARLAEAQARLLANEAERIHLLRSWRSELIKQSHLLNATNTKSGVGAAAVIGYENTLSTDPEYTSNLQLTNNQHFSLDKNEPRSISVIPVMNLSNTLSRQTYSEGGIYDYEVGDDDDDDEDAGGIDEDDDDRKNNPRHPIDTHLQVPTGNGMDGGRHGGNSTIGRSFELYGTTGSSMKSQRSYNNRPRMGASAIVTNLYDYHGTMVSDTVTAVHLQSTLPRNRVTTSWNYKANGNNTTTSSPPPPPVAKKLSTSSEVNRISRSPSTPGMLPSSTLQSSPTTDLANMNRVLIKASDNNCNNNHTWSAATATDDIDEAEFARQIHAIVHESNRHLYPE
ncbi:unnamed protein product [Heterobilharzia americana]|nr:unnamed protein product [Heterobilharzia americana]